MSLALAVTLGALALAGCGESSPAAAGANADAGSAPTATSTGSTAVASDAQTGASTVSTTGAGAAATGTTPKTGSAATGAGAEATDAGAASDGAPAHSSSGGGSTSGAGSKAGGSSKSGRHKNVSAKSGTSQPSASSSTPAGSSSPSANTGVPYEVSTISMRPNYQPETKVYYDPTRTQPQIGEVILFYLPTGATEGECRKVAVGGAPCDISMPGLTKLIAIKRVVGLPGDTIEIHDGHVIRNGQPESEPATLACKEEEEGCNYTKAIVVPANYYYVMGDNRRLPQEDSRVFGAVPQEAIVGTVEGG